MQFAGSLLLEGGCGERRGRMAGYLLLVYGRHGERGAYAVLKETAGLVHAPETGVKQALYPDSSGDETALDPVIRRTFKPHYLPFAVHDQTQGDGLHASGGEPPLDLPPEYRGQLEAHQPVEDAPCLLGIHEVHVYLARIAYRIEYRIFGNFVEHDPAGAFPVKPECLAQMPRDGLSLAVLIGCQPHGLRRVGGLFKVGDNLFLVCRNYIFGPEPVLHVHAELIILKVTDMAET